MLLLLASGGGRIRKEGRGLGKEREERKGQGSPLTLLCVLEASRIDRQ
jgi:hypothetical protein